ncbi:DNA-binding LytR/AlgR family response regulator [Virgibacillus natechei]|uniref:DNA-binding LytR/AlgR family response regulator n=1 Tax=Virgibacillus natechei TaxID=1216297 RepID=A0ABS4IHY2_9BACI|nr:LytTR family DNA-binding domain-containing protein [Virgibacillus natechei]MBP1970559.1 DNA-binding LytR/AlgR family response regulator [Virgibacillus natechei]UZD14041.1 LytTR family DNA-binding domain-containing protein [Virgibacillus natechei]
MIRAIIAEDEKVTRDELIYVLQKEEDVYLCPSAETGEQLLELFFEYKPDVVFLDVHMPGISGVEAAKRLTELNEGERPLFIFTTAYDDYAIQAFEIEAVDYLLKPYDHARFHQSMERLRNQLRKSDIRESPNPSSLKSSGPSKLLIDDGEKTIVLHPDMIYYAVPFKRMLEIHTEDNVIMSRMTLQELEKKLSGYTFLRTHRSYLVNLDHIQEITPWFNGTSNITLKDKDRTSIPVSRASRKILFDFLE